MRNHPIVTVRCIKTDGGKMTENVARWIPYPLRRCKLYNFLTRSRHQCWRFVKES